MPLSTYLPERMGHASISPDGEFEAGSLQSFELTYTAGSFGIDDSGGIRVVFRHVSDMGKPQTDDPAAHGYLTAEASNGAQLHVRYDDKNSIRPWDRTITVRVVRGFLREGDRIVVRIGDTRAGSSGIRMQTFCEDTFEFRVLVDAIATCDYVQLPASPTMRIVPGPPVRWKAVLPTLRRVNEPFALGLKGEDAWGNPSDRCEVELRLRAGYLRAGGSAIEDEEHGANAPPLTNPRRLPATVANTLPRPLASDARESAPLIDKLPETVRFVPGELTKRIEGLSATTPGDFVVGLIGPDGDTLTRSNPMRVVAGDPDANGARSAAQTSSASLMHVWGDLHGQSEETIGTNSARDYFLFARDRAFLDVTGHQGNDFQITNEFWAELNELTREFNRDGEFVVFPGYEWSGNTALGGDRNVHYLHEGRPIYRSSHALVPDLSDAETDAHSAADLFDRLRDEDCIVVAHVGGRYSDIGVAHDERIERAVEIHSAWGTFEWLVHDALERGYRVGICANSDGHKCRPGASYPGAATFGAYGGLTCFLADELTRDGIADALRRRHMYATSGARIYLDVRAELGESADLVEEREGEILDDRKGELLDDRRGNPIDYHGTEPRPGSRPDRAASRMVTSAIMGDVVRYSGDSVLLHVDVIGCAPIERVEFRSGAETIETYRPFEEGDLGRHIRVIWEGAEYRGRGRQTIWDGQARLEGNGFTRVEPINRYNLDKRSALVAPDRLEFEALTTGGFGGFDAWLEERSAGTLILDTPLVKTRIDVADIGIDDLVLEVGGIGRRVRVFRLPNENSHVHASVSRRVPLRAGVDNPIWVCVTTEDGHRAWSSPVYVVR